MESSPSVKALAVAYLTAQGRRQNEIAAILKTSQAAVSRLYKDVSATYIQHQFRADLVDEPTLRKVIRLASPNALDEMKLKAFAESNGSQCPVVHRVPTSSDFPVAEFASQAAVVVRDFINRVRAPVGVAWGNTIWHLSQALRALPPQRPWREGAPVEFVPLCGDPVMDSIKVYADRTSSRIASELSKTVNGDKFRPAWLGLVPAFIPRSFAKKDEIRVINSLIDLVPQYGRIFGFRDKPGQAQPPVALDLHMILTGAGSAENPLGFGGSPLLDLSAAEATTLAENIYGDIGGVLVPRLRGIRGAEPGPFPLVQELTRHWTGLKMEHLKNCSRRAFEQDPVSGERPGVVLLGFRADRAPVVLEAVRLGLVNHLIIGSGLESAISGLIQKRMSLAGVGATRTVPPVQSKTRRVQTGLE